MAKNQYFENLVFGSGERINVSEEIDANYSGNVHWHPYAEVLVSLSDGNEVTVNFVTYQLKTNDIIFVYSGSLHSIRNVSEHSFLVIQFPLELITAMKELKAPLAVLSDQPLLAYDPCRIASSRILMLISEIREAYFSGDSFREAETYSLLLRLFIMIGRFLEEDIPRRTGREAKMDEKNTDLITEACLYISENCAQPLTLDGVSRHIGVSRSHFAHLFRAHTNMTFIEFLTAERIKLAESYFLDPKMHIVDIAFESGFSSISSFNRAFRRLKGCSPTEFRKTRVD